MRKISFVCLLMALTACTALSGKTPTPAATADPATGMANPASVYCLQQGNRHEIRTADDGSQTGVCIFPDGATCEEWAYFRGECGPKAGQSADAVATQETVEGSAGDNAASSSMPSGATEQVNDWWGVIKATGPGAQFDDYFERQDLGQLLYFGIEAQDAALKAQIEALRDSGKIVHLYGVLISNLPDYNGSQILVERLEVEE